MFERILVATDGSESSGRAVGVAAEIALGSRAEVLVVHVHRHEVAPGVHLYSFDLTHREAHPMAPVEESGILTAAVDELTRAGIAARGEARVIRHDDVARELLDTAADYGADAIVIGSRGHSAFAGLLLGGVAHKVLQFASCPVVVVR